MANTFIGPDGYEYSPTVPGPDPRSVGNGMPMPIYGNPTPMPLYGNPNDSRYVVQQMLRNMQQNRQQRIDSALGQTQASINAINRAGGLGGFGDPVKTAAINARRRAMNVNAPGIPQFMRDKMDRLAATRLAVKEGTPIPTPMFVRGDQNTPYVDRGFTKPVIDTQNVAASTPPEVGGSTQPPLEETETTNPLTALPYPSAETAAENVPPATQTPPAQATAPVSNAQPAPVETSSTTPTVREKDLGFWLWLANSPFGQLLGASSETGIFGSDPAAHIRREAELDRQLKGTYGDLRPGFEDASRREMAAFKEWLNNATLPEIQRFHTDPNYHQEILDSVGFMPNRFRQYLGDVDAINDGIRRDNPYPGDGYSAIVEGMGSADLGDNPLDASVPIPFAYEGGFTRTTPRTMYNDTREAFGLERTDPRVDPRLAIRNDEFEQRLQQDIYEGERSNNPVAKLRGIEAKIVLARRTQMDAESELNNAIYQDYDPLRLFNTVGEYFTGRRSYGAEGIGTLRSISSSAQDQLSALERQRDMLMAQFPGLNTQGMTPSEYMTMMDDRFAGPNESQIASDAAYAARIENLIAADNELSTQRYLTDIFPVKGDVSSIQTDPWTGESIDMRMQPDPVNYADEDNFLSGPSFGTGLSVQDWEDANARRNLISPADVTDFMEMTRIQEEAAQRQYQNWLLQNHAEFNNYATYGTGPDIRGYNDPLYTPGFAPGIPASPPRVPLNYLPAPPVPPINGPIFNPRIPIMRAAPGVY